MSRIELKRVSLKTHIHSRESYNASLLPQYSNVQRPIKNSSPARFGIPLLMEENDTDGLIALYAQGLRVRSPDREFPPSSSTLT